MIEVFCLPIHAGGNILNFSVSSPEPLTSYLLGGGANAPSVKSVLCAGREGEGQSITQSLESIKTCLRQGGLPVLSQVSTGAVDSHLITSLIGGLIPSCSSAPPPRTNFAWQ